MTDKHIWKGWKIYCPNKRIATTGLLRFGTFLQKLGDEDLCSSWYVSQRWFKDEPNPFTFRIYIRILAENQIEVEDRINKEYEQNMKTYSFKDKKEILQENLLPGHKIDIEHNKASRLAVDLLRKYRELPYIAEDLTDLVMDISEGRSDMIDKDRNYVHYLANALGLPEFETIRIIDNRVRIII